MLKEAIKYKESLITYCQKNHPFSEGMLDLLNASLKKSVFLWSIKHSVLFECVPEEVKNDLTS